MALKLRLSPSTPCPTPSTPSPTTAMLLRFGAGAEPNDTERGAKEGKKRGVKGGEARHSVSFGFGWGVTLYSLRGPENGGGGEGLDGCDMISVSDSPTIEPTDGRELPEDEVKEPDGVDPLGSVPVLEAAAAAAVDPFARDLLDDSDPLINYAKRTQLDDDDDGSLPNVDLEKDRHLEGGGRGEEG
eukprot:822420-Pyramimonas_sp.AAC.1